jgi:hypothetical protein
MASFNVRLDASESLDLVIFQGLSSVQSDQNRDICI